MKNWLGSETSEANPRPRVEQLQNTEKLGSEDTGFLPHGFRLEGTLDVSGALRIDGGVKGTVRSQSQLSLGKEAHIEGEVQCAFLSVGGKVNGNVHCTERLDILSTGLVEGDVHTPALGIEPGGILEGRCHMQTEAKAGTASKDVTLPMSVVWPASEGKGSTKPASAQGMA